MAIVPSANYPGKIASDPTNYPYGKARNITVPGDGTGTPWEQDLVNDILGFQQKLLTEAGISPSGNPDTIVASNYWDALLDAIASNPPTPPSNINIGDPSRGLVWEQGTPASGASWSSVAYDPDIESFVAVADSGGSGFRVMRSVEGVEWFLRPTPADNAWKSICFGDSDKLVAVASSGSGNRAMSSDDGGVNWTIRTTPVDNSWSSVVWGESDGLFVAVADSGTGNRAMSSPDGTTWTIRSSSSDASWKSVCYTGTRYVAVASTGSNVMVSDNGTSWVDKAAVLEDWQSVCYSPELTRLVAVANTGTGNRVMTSDNNGDTWTSRVSAADHSWGHVIWARNRFIAFAGLEIMTSEDGITWTLISTTLGAAGAAYGNGLVVGVEVDPIISGFLATT